MTTDQGPVVALTGASSGLGLQLAVQLARRGARLALMSRRVQPLEEAAARARGEGGQAMVLPLDVADAAAVADAVARVEEAWGPVDLAVANAGTGAPVVVDDFTAAESNRVMRVNYEGPSNLFAAVLPAMLARGSGHLVGVSSVAAFRGLPASGPYSASKAALSTLMESLRIELVPRGIGVTVVHPGFIRTPLTEKNPFAMPFILEADDAASRILRRLDAAPRTIEFPWPLVWAGRLGRFLPDWLWDVVMRRQLGAM